LASAPVLEDLCRELARELHLKVDSYEDKLNQEINIRVVEQYASSNTYGYRIDMMRVMLNGREEYEHFFHHMRSVILEARKKSDRCLETGRVVYRFEPEKIIPVSSRPVDWGQRPPPKADKLPEPPPDPKLIMMERKQLHEYGRY
jgi:hypothetical protein